MSIVDARGPAGDRPVAAMRYRPPRLIDPLVHRPDIAARMAAATGMVTLIIGPPGSGKTSVLAEHHAARSAGGEEARWLTLSGEDNDPAVLRRHLDHAFGAGGTGQGGEGATFPPEHIVAFIDGLERLDNPGAHVLIEEFVLALPPSSSAHITAHRLRGALLHDGWLRGVVQLIGPDALRLSDEEAARLLGKGWSPWDCQRLNEAVEGWAAGLRFAARAPESARLLLNGAGEQSCPPEMADYLDDVVCAAIEPETLAALMDVSVLDRFTPEALAAMPGRPCEWSHIDRHIRDGLFIRYVDDQRNWAAFHPVFGRHLRQRLRRFDPARYEALNRFAASWFETNGFGAEAIRHAVAMADSAFAARIIENAGAIHVDLCDGPDVGLGERVPAAQARALPLLFLGQLYFIIRRGRSVEARAAFEEARRLTRGFTLLDKGADVEAIQGFAQLVDMVLDATEDRAITEQRLTALEEAMEAHRGRQPVIAGGVACMLALAYLELSRYAEAGTICSIGLSALQDFKDSKVSVFLRIHQADIAVARDTIGTAALYMEEAQRIARIGSVGESYEVLATRILRAGLHYENNEIDAAASLLYASLGRVGAINAWVRLCVAGFGTAAAIAGIRHGIDAAEQQLRAGEALARERNLPRLLDYLAIARLRELTRAGEWRAAMEHVESARFAALLASESLSPARLGAQVPAMLEVARLMVELGRPYDAQMWLDRINKSFLEDADNRHRFTFRIMAMRAAHGMRRYNAAADHMQAAIDIARHGGLIRRALNNRQHLLEIFDWSARNGRHLPAGVRAYVEDVLRGADGTESGATLQQSSPRRGVEQAPNNFTLSPRETEIIALVAEGYITKEIAVRLGISEGTVKTHRKKIHEKLGVASRSQAIARARDLLII